MHTPENYHVKSTSHSGTHPLVFVISAFLIGLGLGDAGVISHASVILAGGTCGIITFLFLESMNRKERIALQEEALQEAEKQLLNRLNRHIHMGQSTKPPKAPHYGTGGLVRSPLSLKRTIRSNW